MLCCRHIALQKSEIEIKICKSLFLIPQKWTGCSDARSLRDWRLPLLTMNIAYQNRVRLPAKIRVFSDFLVSYIREHLEPGMWIDAAK